MNLSTQDLIESLGKYLFVECADTDNGKKDSWGDGCDWYQNYPEDCGIFDDDDFNSYEMCCGCKGNSWFIGEYIYIYIYIRK